jgi:hypothetical protein
MRARISPQNANPDAAPGGAARVAEGVADPAQNDLRTRVRERPSGKDAEMRKLHSLAASLYGPDGLDREALDRLRAALATMGRDELLGLVRIFDESEMKGSAKLQLEILLAGALARQDRELALDTFLPRDSGSGRAGIFKQLELIYRSWAQIDPAAAASWLERQESMDPGRHSAFCHALIRALAKTDPENAAARFSALGKSSQAEALAGDWFLSGTPEQERQVADFLRRLSDDPATLAGACASRVNRGSLAEAGDFMDRIGASGGERVSIVAEALRGRITDRLELKVSPDEALAWIREQAPEDADRLAGTVLGQFVGWHDFSAMSRQAQDLREASGSDEVLAAFLLAAPAGHRMEILNLAEEIADPDVRHEVTRRFINNPNRTVAPEARGD